MITWLGHPIPVLHAVPRTDYAKGVVYAVAAGIALGTLGPISNVAYSAGVTSATFAAMRASIGAIAVVAVLLATHNHRVALRSLTGQERAMLGLTALAQATLSLTLFAAYGAMAVAIVVAVYFCYPLLVSVTSILLGRERLTLSRSAGLVAALAGLAAVVLGGTGAGLGAVSVVGIALAGVAATCQATYVVASRSGYSRVPSEQAAAIILGCAAILMWLVALPAEILSNHSAAWIGSPVAWLAVLLAGILGAACAKVWLLRGVRRVGGTRGSVLMLSEPLTAVILAAFLLNQGLAHDQIVGGVFVLVGALLAQRPASALR